MKILIKKTLTVLTSLLILQTSLAQGEWNWPEGKELQSQAREKQAYYKIQSQLDDLDGTFGTLLWLYTNNPKLNPSIYIDGVKVIQSILKKEEDKERIAIMEDSLLWMFDQRAKFFGNEAKVMDRKAYDAFKVMYRTPARYSLLQKLFEKAFELNGNDISDFSLIPYMSLAKFYYEKKPNEMTPEKVLEIHSRVSEAIDYKISNGGKVKKLKKDQNKADALLSSLNGILTCDFIEKILVPKMEADPSDLNTAKKIFIYSLQAKCSDQPYFSKAGEIVYKDKPTFNLAKALGYKYYNTDNNDKALEYYTKARELAAKPEEKFDTAMGMANVNMKLGRKITARTNAREASSHDPQSTAPYNLIGNLYFSSFANCKGGESKVLDRAIFIAAYNMYQKAGNNLQMAAAKEQFPSIEDIFNENYEEGQEVNLGCWINTSVKLSRRTGY